MISSKYKRILVKISGEALSGKLSYGYDPFILQKICKDLGKLQQQNIQICLVIGGGNIFRGISAENIGLKRINADYMGMLATVINAIAIQNTFESMGIAACIQSSITMNTICEPYTYNKALKHLSKNRIVIFAGGVGSPFFTTDTAATLRAIEMKCDVLLKATQVDGIYDKDPKKYPDAILFNELSYMEVIQKNLGVMDLTAITLASENNLPIIVLSIKNTEEIVKIVNGEGNYTKVSNRID